MIGHAAPLSYIVLTSLLALSAANSARVQHFSIDHRREAKPLDNALDGNCHVFLLSRPVRCRVSPYKTIYNVSRLYTDLTFGEPHGGITGITCHGDICAGIEGLSVSIFMNETFKGPKQMTRFSAIKSELNGASELVAVDDDNHLICLMEKGASGAWSTFVPSGHSAADQVVRCEKFISRHGGK